MLFPSWGLALHWRLDFFNMLVFTALIIQYYLWVLIWHSFFLPWLQELYLGYNQIAEMNPDSLSAFESLSVLDIRDNKISRYCILFMFVLAILSTAFSLPIHWLLVSVQDWIDDTHLFGFISCPPPPCHSPSPSPLTPLPSPCPVLCFIFQFLLWRFGSQDNTILA